MSIGKGKGPLRFSRAPRLQAIATLEPKPQTWHRSARTDIDEKQYIQLVGLCGYTVPPSVALFLGYKLTRAIKPGKGSLCAKCEQIAADEAEYLRRHQPPTEGDSHAE